MESCGNTRACPSHSPQLRCFDRKLASPLLFLPERNSESPRWQGSNPLSHSFLLSLPPCPVSFFSPQKANQVPAASEEILQARGPLLSAGPPIPLPFFDRTGSAGGESGAPSPPRGVYLSLCVCGVYGVWACFRHGGVGGKTGPRREPVRGLGATENRKKRFLADGSLHRSRTEGGRVGWRERDPVLFKNKIEGENQETCAGFWKRVLFSVWSRLSSRGS